MQGTTRLYNGGTAATWMLHMVLTSDLSRCLEMLQQRRDGSHEEQKCGLSCVLEALTLPVSPVAPGGPVLLVTPVLPVAPEPPAPFHQSPVNARQFLQHRRFGFGDSC